MGREGGLVGLSWGCGPARAGRLRRASLLSKALTKGETKTRRLVRPRRGGRLRVVLVVTHVWSDLRTPG